MNLHDIPFPQPRARSIYDRWAPPGSTVRRVTWDEAAYPDVDLLRREMEQLRQYQRQYIMDAFSTDWSNRRPENVAAANPAVMTFEARPDGRPVRFRDERDPLYERDPDHRGSATVDVLARRAEGLRMRLSPNDMVGVAMTITRAEHMLLYRWVGQQGRRGGALEVHADGSMTVMGVPVVATR